MGVIHSSNSKTLVLRMCPGPGLVPAASKYIVFLSPQQFYATEEIDMKLIGWVNVTLCVY